MKGKRGDTTNWKHCDCGDVAWTTSNGYVMLIDSESLDNLEIARRNWWVPKNKPTRVHGTRLKGDPCSAYLHQKLMAAPAGMVIDHLNRNPLDNRRCNLRLATYSQNAMNRRQRRTARGPYKGVWKHKTGKWESEVVVGGKRRRLGLYETPEAAKAAYDAEVSKAHGDFALKKVVGDTRFELVASRSQTARSTRLS